jgi:hypothetical protein
VLPIGGIETFCPLDRRTRLLIAVPFGGLGPWPSHCVAGWLERKYEGQALSLEVEDPETRMEKRVMSIDKQCSTSSGRLSAAMI